MPKHKEKLIVIGVEISNIVSLDNPFPLKRQIRSILFTAHKYKGYNTIVNVFVVVYSKQQS